MQRSQFSPAKFKNDIDTGTYINKLSNTPGLDANSKFIVEETDGFFNVCLAAKQPYKILGDKICARPEEKRNTPSLLRKDPPLIEKYLTDNNVAYVIVKNKDLKGHFKNFFFACEIASFGKWAIYKMDLSRLKARQAA